MVIKRHILKTLIVITVFSLVLLTNIDSRGTTTISYFNDIGNHWAERDIIILTVKGIIHGYGDGSFRPNRFLTRAEYLKLLIHSLDYEEEARILERFTSSYEDANNHWAKGYIEGALEKGIVIEESMFEPNKYIYRMDMAVMAVRGLLTKGINRADLPLGNNNFSDWVEFPESYHQDALIATGLGLIVGMPDGTFRPMGNMTRGEAVTIIRRVLEFQGKLYDYSGNVLSIDNGYIHMETLTGNVRLKITGEPALYYKGQESLQYLDISLPAKGGVILDSVGEVHIVVFD